jgi:hypothetical protein
LAFVVESVPVTPVSVCVSSNDTTFSVIETVSPGSGTPLPLPAVSVTTVESCWTARSATAAGAATRAIRAAAVITCLMRVIRVIVVPSAD